MNHTVSVHYLVSKIEKFTPYFHENWNANFSIYCNGIKQEPNNCELSSEDTSEIYNENHFLDKPFVCKICDSEFAYQDGLDGHVASVHEGNIPIKCENKRLKCVKCDACFTKIFTLVMLKKFM